MGTRATYQKTLIQACIAVGDETMLAQKLGAPVPDVVDWLLGDRPVPPDCFLKAVDIVQGERKRHVNEVKAFLEEVRRRRRLG
jgi:DNA-binding transcriptional regulator YdaS (Cro superfamily)